MSVPRYTQRELTKHLRSLAMEAEGMSDAGDIITRAEALARALWKKALGFKAMEMREGGMREVDHAPEAWAIQLIYERLEGKVANAAPEEGGKIAAVDRVSELARNRVNALASASVGIPGNSRLPPVLLKKKDK